MSDRNFEDVLRRLRALEQWRDRNKVEVPTYATGTWTPALSGDGAAPGAFTYNAGATGGTYTREGNIVIFRGRVYITAITGAPTAGSNMRISLPTLYTVATDSTAIAGNANISQTGITFTAGYHQVTGYVLSASPYVYLSQSGSGVVRANILAANVGLVGGAIDFIFAGSYQVA